MIDIFITGSSGAIGQRILPKLEEKNFRITPINLRKLNNLESIRQASDNSWMIHLASINSKISSEQINIEENMIKSAIDIALLKGVQNFIFFSSSKLYPATDKQNLASEASDTVLKDPYSKSKINCELILKAHAEKFKSASVFRLAPVLIRSPSSNVNLLFKICEIIPVIPLFPAGNTNRRSFLSLRNLEIFLQAYIEQCAEGYNVLNVCDRSPISTNFLINEFLDKYRPNVAKFCVPKFLEYLALNLPILGKRLHLLYADNVIDNDKIRNQYSNLNLLETSEAIRLHGLY